MQIVTGRRGEPHVTSRQMQAVYRSFLGDFALLDIGEKLRAEAYSDDIVRVYDGVVSVQGIYAVIAYNQYDEVYIEPVSVGKKRIDTIVLHYTKNNTLDVEDMQLDVVQGEEYTDNPIAPIVPEGGDAWEGTTDIQVPIYDVEVTNFGLTVIPHARMLTVIPTLDSIAERIPETVVTGVKGDSEVLYRDGDVNITKANIGLGNVDNTADTDKPISTATQTALNLKADLTYVDAKISAAYHAGGNLTVAELTSALLITENMGKVYNMSDSGVTTSDFVEGAGEPINKGDNVGICNVGTEESPVYKFDLLSGFVDLSAYATTSAVNTALAGKVDKVAGKGLSTEDYTTTEKTKLAGISEGATQTVANPADTATETLSKLEVGGVVYDVPQGTTGATNLSELNDVNLSGTAEGDILEYDSTANKWKNSNALQGSKTATGNPITVTDCAPVNAVNLSVDLEPVQDLHGYDHPWVGGAGKNLYIGSPSFDGYEQIIGWEKQTETYNGHDVYKRSGRWSGAYKVINLATGTYTFSAMVKVGSACSIYLFAEVANVTTATLTPVNKSVSLLANTWTRVDFTFEVTTAGAVALRVENGNNGIDTYISEYQLEAGNQATSYADYENICPISGRSEVAIQRDGKNLIDDSDVRPFDLNGATGIPIYSASCHAYVVKGVAGKTVTVSRSAPSSSSAYFWYGAYSDELAQGIIPLSFGDLGSNNLTATINVPNGTVDLVIFCSTDNPLSLQCELGSPATTYEPYAGKTYTIQIGQTVYKARVYPTKGYAELVGKKVTLDGTQTISMGSSNRASVTYSDAKIIDASNQDTDESVICDRLKSVSWGGLVNETSACSPKYGQGIAFKFNGYTTAQEYITYFTNNPTDFVYELATPYTIQLTPQQIKLLENTNTVYTDYDGDIITIEYQPNNAIGEAVRIVEESYDHEFAVRPVLKKKAFSGTTDTDGSVTLINASDIPSNHRIIPLQITDMTIDGNAGTYFVEYEPYNSGDSVKGYCYFYMSGSQMFPVGKAITGNFYYYELEV